MRLLCRPSTESIECNKRTASCVFPVEPTLRSIALLTENEVSRSWSKIFGGGSIDSTSIDRAEQLLDGLRPESPLRHRLTVELEELRKIHSKQLSMASQDS